MLAQKTGSSQGINARGTEERKQLGSPTPLRGTVFVFQYRDCRDTLDDPPAVTVIHNLLAKPLGSKSI